LITNMKSHTFFHADEMKVIYLIDDLEGQYCNRNCIGCSASFPTTAGFLVLLLTVPYMVSIYKAPGIFSLNINLYTKLFKLYNSENFYHIMT